MIHDNWGLPKLERMPSEYLKDRNYWGFLHDPVGIKRRDSIGSTRSCGAPTSPTPPASIPTRKNTWQKTFAGVPENELRAMLVDNCVRYFHLND